MKLPNLVAGDQYHREAFTFAEELPPSLHLFLGTVPESCVVLMLTGSIDV